MTMAKVTPARLRMTENRLILLVALFITVFGNFSFFSRVLAAYPLTSATAPALLSLVVVLLAVNVLLLGCLGLARMTRPVLVLFLVLSALAAYFMDSYGIVINVDMLHNAMQTQASEVRDLLNLKLLSYALLLGGLPALLVMRVELNWRGWRVELIARLKLIASTLLALVAVTLIFGGFYASFVREHKPLRSYANPTYWIYSALRYASEQTARDAAQSLVPHGTDARVPPQDQHRELIVLVVGETARADHFSLNGYARETNPRLREAGAISFNNFWACGTSTAAALPCMFADATLGAPQASMKTCLMFCSTRASMCSGSTTTPTPRALPCAYPIATIGYPITTPSVMKNVATRACCPGCRRISMPTRRAIS